MKNLIIIVVIGISMMACTSTTQQKQDDHIKLVKDYVSAVENLDYEAMSQFLDDDYLGMGPSFGDSISKMEAIENWQLNVEYLYESIKYNRSRFASVNIPDGENKGYWIANWAELHIVYKNGDGEVTIWANTNYLIKNGKIIKSLTFYNEADALRQLGYEMVYKQN